MVFLGHPPPLLLTTPLPACTIKAYGYELPADVEHVFTHVRKTHNSGVFDVYTDEMKRARKSGILSGLPDGYGRGRIIGDYRRVRLRWWCDGGDQTTSREACCPRGKLALFWLP